MGRERERERERQRQRQTDRQTERQRQTGTETDRQTDRQTEIDRKIETERRDRDTYRERETDRDRDRQTDRQTEPLKAMGSLHRGQENKKYADIIHTMKQSATSHRRTSQLDIHVYVSMTHTPNWCTCPSPAHFTMKKNQFQVG